MCSDTDLSLDNCDKELCCLGETVKLSQQGKEVNSLGDTVTYTVRVCCGCVVHAEYARVVLFLSASQKAPLLGIKDAA